MKLPGVVVFGIAATGGLLLWSSVTDEHPLSVVRRTLGVSDERVALTDGTLRPTGTRSTVVGKPIGGKGGVK